MKKSGKKLLALLVTLAMATTMLAGCGGGKAETPATPDPVAEAPADDAAPADDQPAAEPADDTPGSTPRNETLYFNGLQWGKVNDWNPFSPNSNNNFGNVQKDMSRVLVYETLFLYNMVDGQLYPLLGKEWSWNADQTELTVTMNPDAKWNDGTPVTANDVQFTWDMHVKYNSSTGADYAPYIEKIEAKDATTVVLYSKLKDGKPVNPLKVLEYIPKVYVLNTAYLQKVEERTGGDETAFKNDIMDDFVHSGPYTKYYDDDQKLVIVRDDNYWGVSLWGKLPAPKYIAHTLFADNAAGDVAFSAGEVDVSQQFISQVQKMWESGKPVSTYIDEAPYQLGATMPTAWFNVSVNGLDQVAVRKAIAMAVDFDQIVDTAMSGQSYTFAQVPRSVMNPTAGEQALVDHSQLKDVQFAGKDITGANKVLDDAGIVDTDGDGIREFNGKNLSYKAECPEGWSDWNASLEIVAAAGKEIGIQIETYFPDANTYYDDFTTRKFDICMWSPSGASISNPWGRSYALMSSSWNSISPNWGGNYGGWSNDRADELLALIPAETDTAKLKEYYTELSKIYLTEVPSFSLMYRPDLFHTVNESVWTGFPQMDDGSNIPPTVCTDGYGIAALYNLTNVQ